MYCTECGRKTREVIRQGNVVMYECLGNTNPDESHDKLLFIWNPYAIDGPVFEYYQHSDGEGTPYEEWKEEQIEITGYFEES